MDSKRLEAGDERNTSFAFGRESSKPVDITALADSTAGFEVGEGEEVGQEVSEGHHRFPIRKSKDEIPQESLAERLRAARQGD